LVERLELRLLAPTLRDGGIPDALLLRHLLPLLGFPAGPRVRFLAFRDQPPDQESPAEDERGEVGPERRRVAQPQRVGERRRLLERSRRFRRRRVRAAVAAERRASAELAAAFEVAFGLAGLAAHDLAAERAVAISAPLPVLASLLDVDVRLAHRRYDSSSG